MRSGVAERPLQHVSPDKSGNREPQRAPKLAPEHLRAVSGMLIVPVFAPTCARFVRVGLRSGRLLRSFRRAWLGWFRLQSALLRHARGVAMVIVLVHCASNN